ncbi:hypothetical protein HYALB_00000669 [Hymenoscyphus albidus]|uniref:Uncharacterized protein n=1 Tax=Hymenoscyphus albidus TaxID=595503 RepID=A0A9N9Q369_9HELO|nr:hypothetical protein HYALB_00000669 [Hymenoscyphus albidus]
MRPRDSHRGGDGVNMSTRLIGIAENQERFFGSKYVELPKKKFESLQKWSDWAEADDLRYAVKRGVDFMRDVERCISGELRLLLEMSGDELPEKLFSRLDIDDIPDLRAYWDRGDHPDGLKETHALFKAGKLPPPEDVVDSGSVNLEPAHILRFLAEFPGLYPSAEMQCPFPPEARPSVEIRYQIPFSTDFEFVKMELSHGLCTKIVENHRRNN